MLLEQGPCLQSGRENSIAVSKRTYKYLLSRSTESNCETCCPKSHMERVLGFFLRTTEYPLFDGIFL